MNLRFTTKQQWMDQRQLSQRGSRRGFSESTRYAFGAPRSDPEARPGQALLAGAHRAASVPPLPWKTETAGRPHTLGLSSQRIHTVGKRHQLHQDSHCLLHYQQKHDRGLLLDRHGKHPSSFTGKPKRTQYQNMDLKTNVSKTGNPLTEPGDTAEEEGSRGVAGKGERGTGRGQVAQPSVLQERARAQSEPPVACLPALTLPTNLSIPATSVHLRANFPTEGFVFLPINTALLPTQ